uniref:Mersacidin/lichenicidin family type 2 lantibiotic n=1 Tax=Thermosporothrix sp. COM3 TaxID=2490863 RepID=A0A455SE28_9CHLR|nr:hypothetical protein KTC_03490 [Thermosporothrix sp. COM3]
MKLDVIRAWKDADYRADLSPEALAALPENPVGEAKELTEEELHEVVGGSSSYWSSHSHYSSSYCSCDSWDGWDDWW